MYKAEQPGKKQPACRPGFLRWTSEQRSQRLGSRWGGTTDLWSAQRSFRGTCGWTDLQRDGETGKGLNSTTSINPKHWKKEPQQRKQTFFYQGGEKTESLKDVFCDKYCGSTEQSLVCQQTFGAAYPHDGLKADLPGEVSLQILLEALHLRRVMLVVVGGIVEDASCWVSGYAACEKDITSERILSNEEIPYLYLTRTSFCIWYTVDTSDTFIFWFFNKASQCETQR